MSSVKRLSPDKRAAFEDFYASSLQQRILPVVADFALLAMLINAITNIGIQFRLQHSWTSVHPLAYLYLSSLVLLTLSHRYSPLRLRSPLTVYLIFALAATFAYRDFVVELGWLEPVYGLVFLLAFVGYLCISIKHSLLIIAVNLVLLIAAHHLVYDEHIATSKISLLFYERFVLACFFTAIASIFFVRWLFRNLLAMQFLLADKNKQLEETFRTLKSTEESLIQQQKYHALNLMAKGLLHEIINPVNNSSQALGFARTMNKDSDVEEALEEGQAQLERISSILCDLRAFAQTQTQKDKEHAEVLCLVEKALNFCRREIDNRNIEVCLHIPDRLSIECYPSAVVQVFVNLLLNSAMAFSEHTTEQAREVSISCSEDNEDEHVQIMVRDNGEGIAKEYLKQVSDPFFSMDKGDEKMGLGLSICQTIMRHHGGCMEIQSQQGEWTEIRLVFPNSSIAPAADGQQTIDLPQTPSVQTSSPTPTG